MKSALVILLALTTHAHADDARCLNQVLGSLQRSLPVLSPPIQRLVGTFDPTTVQHSNVEYSRAAETGDFKDIADVGLEYSVRLKEYELHVDLHLGLNSDSDSQEAVPIVLKQELEVRRANGGPLVYELTNYNIDKSCAMSVGDGSRTTYGRSLRHPGLIRLTTTKMVQGLTSGPSSEFRNVDLIRSTAVVNRAQSVAKLKNSGLLGREIFYLNEGTQARAVVGNLQTRFHFDPITGRSERFELVDVDLMFAPGESARATLLASTVSSYTLLKFAGGSSTEYRESITAQQFLATKFSLKHLKESVMPTLNYGSTNLDFGIRNSVGLIRYTNFSPYGRLAFKNRVWRVRLEIANPPPILFSWNAAVEIKDQRYLMRSRYINPERVRPIAESLIPSLAGLNRLEASRVLIRYVISRLTYDANSLTSNTLMPMSTEQILTLNRGVCQHYAALFTAIARALGIPSRVISGYYVSAKGLQAHAWVEVKVNQTDWWPLEPQVDADRLPQAAYLPLQEGGLYDVRNETEYKALAAWYDRQADFYDVRNIVTLPGG